MTDAFLEANRASWDERVGVHLRDTTGIYPLEAFRRGADTLTPIEATEIGDVAGKRILHLQCHFGIDTLSLARRGADVTGLDFSPKAIEAARAFSAELGIPARFVEANVYDAPAATGGGYDMVFTSWGTTIWLPDINRWAAAVAGCLVPGGSLYFADGHPSMMLFTEREGRLELGWPWRNAPDDPSIEDDPQSYAGDGTPLANSRTFGWLHPFSTILGALKANGLDLEYLHEHEMVPWQPFPSMVREGQMYVQPPGQIRIPLAFSLKATKRRD
ncbi:MAG: class I SAM-dependent methyltransferase [Bauldia sp.]|nr:class I SAM-dependent methyltransferase [Bauldia sp.]